MGRNRKRNKRNREQLAVLQQEPRELRDPRIVPHKGDVLQVDKEIRYVLKAKIKRFSSYSFVVYKSENSQADLGNKSGFTLVKKSTIITLNQSMKISLSEWQTWCQLAKVLYKKP